MTVDEKNTLDNLLQSLQISPKDNIETVAPAAVLAAEALAGTVAACARTPACVSAVVNLFGTATASAILNSGEEKKETHPKGVPSTSGNSATGMPPNGDDDSKISFGENSNRLHHTWRHVDKIGLPRSQVQDAIQKDILKRNISKLEIQKPHNFNTVVNGRKIQYTVYRINSTETRIQRIHGVP